MKNHWEWEEEDIDALIREGVQESLTLDYKRCASLDKRNPNRKTDLSKDVSAFANSAGGVLIYGVVENNHLPVAIDTGYDPYDVTREWLEQVINSTIQRRIDGIKIKQIELRTSNPGKVIYVVSVPQSKRAPHMAEDHIFYKRYNYQSIPMEEYEVRDVARREEAPDLTMQLYIPQPVEQLSFPEDGQSSNPFAINAIIQNKSATPAMYYIARIALDKRLNVLSSGEFQIHEGNLLIESENERTPVIFMYANCSVPSKMPVWQGVSYRISNSHISISIPKSTKEENYILVWFVTSPGMQKKNRSKYSTSQQ